MTNHTADAQHFNSIHVVEALGPNDARTGTELFEGTIRPIIAECAPSVLVTLHRPATLEALRYTLWQIAAEAKAKKSSPILHLETHGVVDGSGIVSGDGEPLPWEDLREVLTEINTNTGLNLLVVMASCMGAHLARLVHPHMPAPVWGLIGSPEEVTPRELLCGFRAFYAKFLRDLDGRSALEALNQVRLGRGKWKFHFYSARFLFRIVFRGYLLDYCSEEALQKREDEILARGPLPNPTGPPESDLRAFIRNGLRDHKYHFDRVRRRFFMLPRFPENEERFLITLADCERDPADDPN